MSSSKERTNPILTKHPLRHASPITAILDSGRASESEVLVPLSELRLRADQPRRYFDPEAMRSFVASVRSKGILQPLLVRKVEGGYEIVAGERRFRAAQEVGLTRVPVLVRDWSDEEVQLVALVENLQREDLNPVEETEGIIRLLSVKLEQSDEQVVSLLYRMENEVKGKITHNVMGNQEAKVVEEAFEAISRQSWRSFVANRLPLRNLPSDVLEALRMGRIEYTKARLIAKVTDPDERSKLLERAINEDLSLSQLRKAVDNLASTQQLAKQVFSKRLQSLGRVLGNQRLTEAQQARVEALLGELEKIAGSQVASSRNYDKGG